MEQVQRPCSRFRIPRSTEDGCPQTNSRGLSCKRKEGRALQRRSASECWQGGKGREEVQECRRSTMKIVADDSKDQNGKSLISKRLAAAIADVHVTENKISQLRDDDDGNYRACILEHELMQQLINLNEINTKSSSAEYKMRLQTIEDNGMKAIQKLKE